MKESLNLDRAVATGAINVINQISYCTFHKKNIGGQLEDGVFIQWDNNMSLLMYILIDTHTSDNN